MSGPFKMKGFSRHQGISPFKAKPTKKELRDAANNKDNPNHMSNQESESAYYAWRGGSKLAKNKTYHGAGGKIMNEDGSVNKPKTNANTKNT
mgnify:CR=1 FL=1